MMSTQTRHPWRASLRTAVAATIAAMAVIPQVVEAAGVETVGWVAALVAVCTAVTRVMALPAVDAWLRQYLPWLAPDPPHNVSAE